MTDIAPLSNTDIAPVGTDKFFNSFATDAVFIPRIQLYSFSSNLVKVAKIPPNSWGLVKRKDDITNLGPTVHCLPLCYRFQAVDMRGEKVKAYFNPESPEFKAIMVEAAKKVPNVVNKCMGGIQFLLLLDNKVFATYLLANYGGRLLAKPLQGFAQHRQFAKIGSRTVVDKYTYQTPTIEACDAVFDLPDNIEQVKQEFLSQKEPTESDPDSENPTVSERPR